MEGKDKLSIFIVIHNQESLDRFIELNGNPIIFTNVSYIHVGDAFLSDCYGLNIITAREYPYNIEKYKTLLTYTAWYLLSENNLVKTPYVGIFEYDVQLDLDIFKLHSNMNECTLIGFEPRPTDEDLYLKAIPDFVELLDVEELDKAMSATVWSATTNVIISVGFLNLFVNWFYTFIPEILEFKNHPHFHERAINVCAANLGDAETSERTIKYKFFPRTLSHKQLNSHKINL
ncbi:MAG: hypothetical protein HC892_01690 [Saprospiraceae bacterium]|nr:hypothetical protein [Saprospiraceae bacterium]